MATKLRPIKRYRSRSALYRKYQSVAAIITDLNESRDETEIAARLALRLKRVKGRGDGLEAVLRDAVLGKKSKTTINIKNGQVELRVPTSCNGYGRSSGFTYDLPFHVRNVDRRIKQGKIKL